MECKIFRFNLCDTDLKLKVRALLSSKYNVTTLKNWDLKIQTKDIEDVIKISKGWLFQII